MTDQTDRRAERLKAALRENLRRRKAQVRGRSEAPDGRFRDGTGPTPPDPPDPSDANSPVASPPDGDPPQPSEGDPA
ncbi:hypothetical protein ASF22_07700 [Methylobacterium sp. Leaf87]|uniref:hypothetical protein n=1 Tax=Methylobacterium sp. Leaf87 TaxID=1736243 RepID=UPI0006F7DA01|nr:hypothetical protein [Methylobacterium sp. Leaf87]KQO59520.1 hypothetical protein ASF22_07700 [Methylobacterium sp. Leaf87]